MKIAKSNIPADSLVQRYLPADYTDAYAGEVEVGADGGGDAGDGGSGGDAREISPDDIMVAFWKVTGKADWISALFRLRDFLVRFVGLKGAEGMNFSEFEAAIRNGGSYSFMSIPAKNPRETVMLLSDKHLDAYLSIHVAGEGTIRRVSAITAVHFKNRLGHIYFFVIRPFHALIVKALLRRAAATN
jgi:hypothetical protein